MQQQPGVSQHVKRSELAAVGRLELVSWMNHALQADYTSVQDCADGVAVGGPSALPLNHSSLVHHLLSARLSSTQLSSSA